MTPTAFILLFLVAATILLIAELLIPSHGILGLLAGLCFTGAVIACFFYDRWIGLAVLVGSVAVSPFVFNLGMRVWERSPIGRRLILNHSEATPPADTLAIGQAGIVVTELRPMGEAEFDGRRLEVISEGALLPPGTPIRVAAIDQGRPVVRPAGNIPQINNRSAIPAEPLKTL